MTGADAQTLWEQNDSALLKARATGLLFGGALTEPAPGVCRIAAGAGQILDNSDPENPIYYAVVWAQTDIDLSGAVDGVQNWIYVNTSNAVLSTTTEPSHEEYRLTIPLHRVVIRSGAISGTVSVAKSVQQYAAELWDLWRSRGIAKHERSLLLSSGGSGTVNVSAGALYQSGISVFTNPLNPNEAKFAAQSPATFRHVLRTRS